MILQESVESWPIEQSSVDSLRTELRYGGFYDLPSVIRFAEGNYVFDCQGFTFEASDGVQNNKVFLFCPESIPSVIQKAFARFRASGALTGQL